jgi:hypothetical protein
MPGKPKRSKRGGTVNLLRAVDLVRDHLTEPLCDNVFTKIRGTERKRVWTLHRLMEFWTAVILRAPASLTQLLQVATAGTDYLVPRVEATTQAFFSKCKGFSPAFFRGVFEVFTARLAQGAPPRFAREHADVLARFAGIWVVDGSRLDSIAHRLKILWNDRSVILPGCILALYDLGHGIVRYLSFDRDAAAGEGPRAKAALSSVPPDTLLLGDRLYSNGDFFRALALHRLFGLVRCNSVLKLTKGEALRQARCNGGVLTDMLVTVGSGAEAVSLRWINWRQGKLVYDLLTNVLDPKRLRAEEAIGLYRSRWKVERLFLALKRVLNMSCFYAANANAVAMQVFASAIVYNAMRFAQGEVAEEATIAPEEISEAKLFPRIAVASSMAAGAEFGVDTVIEMNPGVEIKRPDLHELPFASVRLADIRVQRRNEHRRVRRFCKSRGKWKSLSRVRGAPR